MTSKWSSPKCKLLAALAAALVLPALSARAADAREEPAEHILQSDVLTVKVMNPNSPARYNQGVRFSPVAAVLQVSLHGKEFLYNPTQHDSLREGAGLASEFDILTEGGPPGFAEAQIGEGFVKIGVGVLQKARDTYDFFSLDEILERAQTTVNWSKTNASFQQICRGVNGYAYTLKADLLVEGSRVIIHWQLSNTGTKAFSTVQYVHNFFSLDEKPVGPGYVLEFSHPIQPSYVEGSEPDVSHWRDSQITFDSTIKTHVNITIPSEGDGRTGIVRVFHRETGQEIVVTTPSPISRTFIHATRRYLCPEQFVTISLQPGASHQWSRLYDFSLREKLE